MPPPACRRARHDRRPAGVRAMIARLIDAAVNIAMFVLPALLLGWADRARPARAARGRR